MANYPQGWQYPQPSAYPQGQAGPGSVARPASMRRAVLLMYAGAAVGLVNGIVDGVATHNVAFYAYSSTSPGTATVHQASSVVAGVITGIIVGGLWLWMAWKTGAGRNWARVVSSVFFGFACLQLIGGVTGFTATGDKVLALVFLAAEWVIGLVALIQLWQRESSQFVTAVRQAKLASAYGAATHGYQQPYGQPSPQDQEPQRPPDDRPEDRWPGPPR